MSPSIVQVNLFKDRHVAFQPAPLDQVVATILNMSTTLHKSATAGEGGSQHLCVLVHGLWGNGSHLNYLTTSLRNKYPDDELTILVCERNSSTFTYDGIEVGAERVTREIEDTIRDLKEDGVKVDRFSIVGYSLGGLIARYTIGLLDSKGYFDYIKPVNFTTFASPHLGVRTPLLGRTGIIWNALGARTLSASGRQLFTVDTFRDTGRPLLSILADPESIFIHALAKFENRCLYANLVNDRSVPFYTANISKIDPYTQLEKLKINYVEGYDNVIVDPEEPFILAQPLATPTLSERVRDTTSTVLRRVPIFAGLSVIIPIAVVFFLVNSGIQTIRSQKRILLHEQDNDENGFQRYRTSWMVQDLRAGIENVYEAASSAHRQEYLPEGTDESSDEDSQHTDGPKSVSHSERGEKHKSKSVSLRRRSTGLGLSSDFPTLALTPEQFAMIEGLNAVGIKKYGVHIQKCRHSHAALIVRSNRSRFDEGKQVVKHWLDRAFIL